jgi:hypothetical protein
MALVGPSSCLPSNWSAQGAHLLRNAASEWTQKATGGTKRRKEAHFRQMTELEHFKDISLSHLI